MIGRNAFYLGLSQIATTALAILLNAAVARALGPSDFGLWYLLTSIATFAYVFVDWGYSPYVTGEIARHPERAGELTGTALCVRAATALVVCGPAMASAWLFGYGVRTYWLTAVMIAAWLPVFLASTYSWTFRGRERMDIDATVSVALKAATLLLTLVFLAFGGRLIAVICAGGIAGVIATALAMHLYSKLELSPYRASMPTARSLIWQAAPMFTAFVGIQIQPYIDVNILAKVSPRDVVGWYGAAATFAGTLMAPASILGAAIFPQLSRTVDQPAQFRQTVSEVLRPLLFLAGLAATGTYLFANVAVGLVYSSAKFGPATVILRVFAPALFLVSFDMLLGVIVVACGKASAFARMKLLATVLTSLLDVVLIRLCQARFGNGGIGVMVSFGLGELVMIAAALQIVPVGTFNRSTVLNVGKAILAGVGSALLVQSLRIPSPIVGIPVCIATFTAFGAILGLLARSEIQLIGDLLTRKAARASRSGQALRAGTSQASQIETGSHLPSSLVNDGTSL